MEKRQKKILVLISCFFFVYFYSEAFLRRAAVSLIDKDKMKIETVINKLPANIRDGVKKEIDYASFQDSLMNAKTDGERVQILTTMAISLYQGNEQKKNEIFSEIVNEHPDLPESVQAFSSLLLNETSPRTVTLAEYRKFIAKLSPQGRYNAWSIGVSALKARKKSADIQFEYMQPLLDFKADFKDYSSLYEYLYDLALNLEKADLLPVLDKKRKECSDLPPIEDPLKAKDKGVKK